MEFRRSIDYKCKAYPDDSAPIIGVLASFSRDIASKCRINCLCYSYRNRFRVLRFLRNVSKKRQRSTYNFSLDFHRFFDNTTDLLNEEIPFVPIFLRSLFPQP